MRNPRQFLPFVFFDIAFFDIVYCHRRRLVD
jgi:hypothetical protein